MKTNMLVGRSIVKRYITKSIQAQLQLMDIEKIKEQLAYGTIVEYDIVESIEVKF